MDIAALLQIAGRQHGCFTRDDALRVISRNALTYLTRRGILTRRWLGVYVVTGTPNTWHQRAMATVLSVPGSALSHRSAARLWGITVVPSEKVAITAPRTAAPRRPGAEVHRSQQLSGYITERDGIPVTTVARTLVDLSSCLSFGQIGAALDQACMLRLVTKSEVEQCLDAMVTVGRSRVAMLRLVLDVRSTADDNIESFLERRTLRWIRRAGLPQPVVQHWVHVNGKSYRLDLAYPDGKIAIETDGPHHLLPSNAAEDRKRDAELRLAGWSVFRVYADMGPEDLLPYVKAALAG